MSLGLVFPGQGSQSVGMLADIADTYPSVRERFTEAGDAIGVALWDIVSTGPEAELQNTAITQPALLTASYAIWEIWQAHSGTRPVALAGHSLGEYSALVCSGALSFTDGVKLVNRRGQLMQEAVPKGEGTMAAILGLDDAVVEACCQSVAGVVAAANYNAPGQTVIAGATTAVHQAVDNCKEAGARRTVLLDVSGPFHCALMLPARDALAAELAAVALAQPSIPIVQNVDAAVTTSLDQLREKLLQQLAEPVLWTQCIQTMVSMGVEHIIECGPGRVLSGLVKRIDKSLTSGNLGTLDGLDKELGSGDA
ncbi:MAG: ACP S-malonyltransferase [Gammaproteobacteria bacterium]|nr:ACP S-malonyltransferase [Gammaproteobacteria bacterium]